MARKKPAGRGAAEDCAGMEYERAVVRGILRGALLLAEASGGAIGRRRLVGFLRGNQLPPRDSLELVSSPTFGLLEYHGASWVDGAIERMIAEGLLTLVPWKNGAPGGVAVSPSGIGGLEDATKLPGPLLPRRPRLGEHPALEERLRAVRATLASKEELPRYGVFSNTVLAAIASLRPRTIAELAGISGLGESRVRKYGKRILAALRE